MRRAAAIWLVLFGVFASTIGLHAFGAARYAGDEPHYLLTAQSIVEDHDLDVRNQYAARSYKPYYPYTLDPHGHDTRGFLHEPHGAGFPLLIAPAYALGGAKGVELFLAALSALALALAYRLALRVVPDPWAGGAALAAGLSPPLLAYSTAVSPEMVSGLLLVAAALLALRLDERISRRGSFACFVFLGLLPWLGLKFVPAGAVVGVYAVRSLFRARRRTLAIGASETAFFSAALYVGINESLYGGPTPYSAAFGDPTGTDAPADYLERSYRLIALMIDRDVGLLRWAPLYLLVFIGLAGLYRSHRDHLARAMPQLRAMQRAATMCAAVVGAQLVVAAFVAPGLSGFWFPGRELVAALPVSVALVAWGLRRVPRLGVALALVSVAASVWLVVAVRTAGDGLVSPRPDAPFGPLTDLFPRFGDAAWPYWLSAAIGAALVAAAVMDVRRTRGAASPA
jgi:hypothetical protein